MLSLGGGAVTSERVRAALARHTVVLLDVDAETAWQRAGGSGRPLARDRDRFDALHAERAPLYDAARRRDPARPTARDDVRRALPASARSARPRPARSCCGRARVPGVRRRRRARRRPSGREGPPLPRHRRGGRPALRRPARRGRARHPHPARRGGQDVGDAGRCCARWPRPGWATTTTWSRSAAAWWATSPGFCAAVYQRGVPVVQVPTTLVAQVDSAYGGKTGVDLPEGKNYVGAYHQPAAGARRPGRRSPRCPRAELAAGWAEVVKTALIAGGDAVAARAPRRRRLDRDLVLACARAKLAVVAPDERDAGPRQALNLGHTVGHAIETATGYRRYRHGEAVGLGLLAALTLSDQPELRDEVAALLAARGLPTRSTRRRPRAVAAAVQRDKKRRGGRVGFVLVEAPGRRAAGLPGERRRRSARRSGGADAMMSNRVAVMHGVNLDMLDRRPPEHYGDLTFAPARAPDRAVRARAGARGALLPVQLRGRVRRGAAPRRRLRGRPAAQPGRLDALRVGAARRGRDRRAARRRGPPLRRRGREEFRRMSVLADVCVARVAGEGVDGYRDALERPQGGAVSRADRVAARLAEREADAPARHRPRQRPLPDGLHRHDGMAIVGPDTAASSPTSATSSAPRREVEGFDQRARAAGARRGADGRLADGTCGSASRTST